jgi:hypothetical protein
MPLAAQLSPGVGISVVSRQKAWAGPATSNNANEATIRRSIMDSPASRHREAPV